MRHVIIAAALALASFAAAARDTVIYSGRLANALNAATNRITNLAYPTDASDAVTKSYVDAAGGMTPQNVGTIATNTVTAKVEAWAMKPHAEPATPTVVTNIVDDFFGLPTETSRTPEYTYVALDEGFTITNFSVDETEEDRVRYQFIWAEGEHLGYNTGATTYRTRPVTPFSQDFTVVDEGGQADPLRVRLTYSMNRYGVARLADAVGIATNAALAVVGPVTNALISVSNTAVSAYTVATNAQARLTSANAGANIAITNSYKFVTPYETHTVYTKRVPILNESVQAYQDESCTIALEEAYISRSGEVYNLDFMPYFGPINLIGEHTTISASGVQTTANIRTNLTENSDNLYPSQKAVKTAIESSVSDMLSSHGGTATRADGETKGVEYTIQGGAEVRWGMSEEYLRGAKLSIGGGGGSYGDGGNGAEIVLGGGGTGDSIGGNGAKITLGGGGTGYYAGEGAQLVIGGHGSSTNEEEPTTYNGTLTITHTGDSSETLTERIVRDASSLTNGFVTADGAKTAVRNDTQLWQDCASPVASNVLETVTTFGASPATGSVIQRLNAVESTVGTANAALQRILEGN